MNIERVLIADLHPADKNTRIHNNKQIDELVRSFRMFGQIRPIIIDEDNVIWCGNGFYTAAKQAGESHIDAYRIVGMDETQKRKLMLADNQTFMLGATNTVVIDEFLAEMEDFDVPGYDQESLQQLYGAMEDAVEEMKGYGVIDQEAVETFERVESARNEVQAERVFTQNETQTPSYVAAVNAAPADDTLPRTIESFNGMVNIPKDKDTRPFIVCPKCGEKIWL